MYRATQREWLPQISKKVKCFRNASFQAEYNGRATSFGEAVDVTCTGHNHPQDQASNKAMKLVSSIRKGHYTALVIIYMP